MDFGPIYIDHIGIATENLDSSSLFWSLLGLKQARDDETVEEQGVTTRFFSTSPHGASMPCLLYTSPSPRDVEESRMPSSA